MVRREQINDDDQFALFSIRSATAKPGLLYANPYGVQQDGIWNDFNEPDYSYDMLWNSQGRVNSQGFVLWFEIPFSLAAFSAYLGTDLGNFFRA